METENRHLSPQDAAAPLTLRFIQYKYEKKQSFKIAPLLSLFMQWNILLSSHRHSLHLLFLLPIPMVLPQLPSGYFGVSSRCTSFPFPCFCDFLGFSNCTRTARCPGAVVFCEVLCSHNHSWKHQPSWPMYQHHMNGEWCKPRLLDME